MKIQSTLFEKISGSVGNITGAMGRGGNYFKTKTNPRNPNTALQKAVRDALSAANIAWSAATDAQHTAWEQYGKTCSYKNNTGNTVVLTGWNAFSRAYVVLKQAGQTVTGLITARPANNGFLTNAPLTITRDAQTTSISIENISTEDVTISLFTGQTTRKTINNYGGSFKWQSFGTIAPGTPLVVDIGLAIGRRWLRVQTATADGQLSTGNISYLDV